MITNHTQLIIEMYKNNIGINKISKILETSIPQIYKCLRENNILRENIEQRNEQICLLYSQRMKIIDISKETGVSRHTVTEILKDNGVYNWEKERASMDDETKTQRNEKAISLYETGLSVRKIAEQLGVCASTVHKILKYYNAEMRPQHQKGHSQGVSKNRKHYFNLDYFKTIDDENKAYWLGFLYADGNVTEAGTLSIALQERDKCHLEKFKKQLEAYTVELKYNANTKSYRLNISSVKIVSDLIALGCVATKSLVLKFPICEQVPENLIHHFMRGYFDGDGCIYIESKYRPCFSILGTPEFLDGYEKHLLPNIGRNSPNKRDHRDSWNEQTQQMRYGGKRQVEKIFEFLYKDATIFLERKYNKFNTLLSSTVKTTEDSR